MSIYFRNTMDWRNMPEGKERYQAYLASREWALLKKAVRERSGGTCEHCLVSTGTETHHTTYIRKYNERLEDLMHVCRRCHEYLSGHGTVDPALDRPLVGNWQYKKMPITSIYLAGKMDNWRDDLIPRWSYSNLWAGSVTPFIETLTLKVKGRKLTVTGPFLGWGGNHHDLTFADHGGVEDVATRIRRAIGASSVVFAWINCDTCFGTLLEIGYAHSVFKPVFVYMDRNSGYELSELWLIQAFSNALVEVDSLANAWNDFTSRLV